MDPSKMGAKVFKFVPPEGYGHLDFTEDIRYIGRQMCTDGYMGGEHHLQGTPSFVVTITNGYNMHCTPLDTKEGRELAALWESHEMELTGLVYEVGGRGKILAPYIVLKR